ncbi:MAG: Sua5/YciO/YrdC/YwlC family protein [Actinomycetota bacterium]|nr:Sua5/YciO/YrdC/YwlC family protein [Actinomycetota bacterium]MDQ3496372.1 Sua5/YciO/YrdC/YwlC family protein [Actinomycetota bacterium]MDQ3602345.1 Sua5/YciO/YrdC/YwlC family protein [Actinomycetota bacterium]
MRTVSAHGAVAALKSGNVALVPTETVVGLVAAEPGLQRIREIKGRDANKPIALLCASAEDAFGLAAKVPPLAVELAEIYWPGPLTLVLDLPSGGTIGVRVPAGKAVRDLLEAYGDPLYATSANLSGEPATAAPDDVDPRVLEAVDIVVRGEKGSGEASAVVDLSGGNVRLVRAARELSTQKLKSLAD